MKIQVLVCHTDGTQTRETLDVPEDYLETPDTSEKTEK